MNQPFRGRPRFPNPRSSSISNGAGAGNRHISIGVCSPNLDFQEGDTTGYSTHSILFMLEPSRMVPHGSGKTSSKTRSPPGYRESASPSGAENLGMPLVSIRPGIVARIGGDILVPLAHERGTKGSSEWPNSMAPFSQPQVAALATISGVGRGAWRVERQGVWHGSPRWLRSQIFSRAAHRGLEAPVPGRCYGIIRSRASYLTRAVERPSSEVWRQPAGARKSQGCSLLSGPGPVRAPTSGLPIWFLTKRREITLQAPCSTPHVATPHLLFASIRNGLAPVRSITTRHVAKTGNRHRTRGHAICSLPDFTEFAQAVAESRCGAVV